MLFIFFLFLNILGPVHSVWGFNFGEKIAYFAKNEMVKSEEKPAFFASISLPFLKPRTNASANAGGFGAGEEIWDLATIGDDTILPTSSPLTTLSSLNQRDEIIVYRVQPGDNPSVIAASFGITINTLLWANSLNYWSVIKVGDDLMIPPVSGVVHKVQNGDTVSSIALKYKAKIDDIIAFNDLPADGALQVGQTLIIPEGEIPAVTAARPIATKATTAITGFINSGQSHPYPYGQCTWWVAQKRPLPNWGNANTWLARAEAAGYSVCRGKNCEPRVGAAISLRGTSAVARRYGHVAYVEKVEGNQVTFSEMNYLGWAKISTRTLKTNDWSILGYIY